MKKVVKTPAPTLLKILDQRRSQHGVFAEHAAVSQELKQVLYLAVNTRNINLAPDQREALEMICHKMARIVSGDPNLVDHWRDLSAYPLLVANRLIETEGATDSRAISMVNTGGKWVPREP